MTPEEKSEYNKAWHAANYDDERKAKKREYDRQYRAKNKDKIKAYQKAHRASNPDLAKAHDRRGTLRRYKLTPEAWDDMFNAQGRCCAACGSTEPKSKTGWHTDHCHSTEVVRGILCMSCNIILGKADDNTETLSNLITYLNERRDVLPRTGSN